MFAAVLTIFTLTPGITAPPWSFTAPASMSHGTYRFIGTYRELSAWNRRLLNATAKPENMQRENRMKFSLEAGE